MVRGQYDTRNYFQQVFKYLAGMLSLQAEQTILYDNMVLNSRKYYTNNSKYTCLEKIKHNNTK